jgi:hypothetical protein
MKLNNHHKLFIILLFLFGLAVSKINAQDSTASTTVLGVRYFLPENKIPYLEVSTKKKVGRKFEPVKGIPVNVYFNEASEINLLGKIITGITGEGRVGFPASFKANWDSLNEFKFVAVSDSSAGVESLSGDVTFKKAILVIDTTSEEGARTVTAQLKEKKGNDWVAVKEIEMKLGIKRMLGNLTVGDAETYTSDSTGIASAGFTRDSMPGDEKGNLVLVARVEDNDNYGNLVVEKTVPWGDALLSETHFWHRTLWSTGNRAPLWLLFIAFSIFIGIWGVIIYLVIMLLKIKKMGREYDANLTS